MKKQKFLSLMLSISMVLSMASTTSLALESDDASRNGKEVLQVSELPKNKNQELNMEEVVAKDTAIPDMEDKATEPVNKSGASSLESEKLSAPTDVVDIPDKEFAKKIKYQLNKPENHKITRSDMEQLKSLVINFGNLENKIEDLEGIQYATNLKSLLIDGDCKNIEKIKGLKNLTHLNLDSVLTFNFSILESMPNLIDLSIDSIPTFNFSMLDSMPNLIKIDLFQIENLQNLNGLTKEKFPKLETLVCSRCKNLEDISALKGQNFPLKKVDFEGYNKISDITPLTGYTSIEELDLEKVTIKDQNRVAYKNTVRSLTGLKVLNMLYCKVTDADVDMFYPLKNLKSLLLNMNKITNTKFCDNLPKDMEALGLHGNKIKNMDNLARFDKLKNLGMGDNSVTDFGFAKSLKNLTSDGIRHSEGSERFPCKQYYRIGEFDHPIENDGDLVVKNPYKDIDGNVIPFENIKSNDDNPTYTVEYNKETNEVTFHNLDGTAYIYVDYDMPVSNGEVKKFKLYIAAYVTKAAVYTVNYDWGKSAPANVTLPKDNEKYNSLYEAKKAVDTTFTKETEVKDTVDGVKGVWKFSGWEVNVRGKEVLCTGNWKFYPDMIAVNEVPKITATDKTLTVGDKFDERDGITAKDYKGQDLTDQIVVLKNEVDTTKAGTYKVTYKVTDKRGASVQKSITVIVNPKAEVINQVPSIEAKDKVLTVGDKFDE
ncbi:immunoglobulin-like domain-containing protein, partial [Faecalimonas sp.]